jgi:protein YIPF1/2
MEEFEYDISHLARAMSVCFTLVFGVPTLWWTVTQCMGMQALMLVDWICIYGYSMVPYLPATILCLIPWHPWMWLCLVGATVTSGSLILRNIAGPLLSADTLGNKTGPLVLAIIACHIIFLLILKVSFYE